MKKKENSFVKNVFSMLIANGVSFLISSLVTFILPKFLSVENYAYIQLYIFYSSYISYLHWGWVDGIRLRYGGIYYDKIDKPMFKSQIFMYSILEIIISLMVLLYILFGGFTGNKFIALVCVSICMLIRLPRLMPQYILEMSNRIEECSRITLLEKITYLFLTLLVVFSGKISVLLLLVADLIGQIVSSIYSFYCCFDIISCKREKNFHEVTKEAKRNIVVGIKLTIANVSSLLIIGIVRQFIEMEWNVSTFGKISLTISISNLLMVFIRSVSMVMFPTLRRLEKNKLDGLYEKIRTCLMIPLLGLLFIYYPLNIIVGLWLPQYSDSLIYMALLFPMCVFESKMSMLIETYFKTLRLENNLLKINLLMVTMSLISTVFTTIIFHNLTYAVLSIVILLAFRCVIAETILSKHINVDVRKFIFEEIIMVMIFILSSWFVKGYFGFILYFISYVLYMIFNKKNIEILIKEIREKRKLK